MNAIEQPQMPEGDDLNDALAPAEESFVLSDAKPNSPLSYIFFALVLAGLGTGYFMFAHSGPKSAMASEAAVQADKRITQFLSGGVQNIAAMDQMLHNTEKEVKKMQAYPSAKQVPLRELKTNPFAYLPIEEKSIGESERQRAEEQQAIVKQAKSLKLQSIMYAGNRSQCMIDNTLYAQGQKIGSLVIEKINASSIVVGDGAVQFELKIQK